MNRPMEMDVRAMTPPFITRFRDQTMSWCEKCTTSHEEVTDPSFRLILRYTKLKLDKRIMLDIIIA